MASSIICGGVVSVAWCGMVSVVWCSVVDVVDVVGVVWRGVVLLE